MIHLIDGTKVLVVQRAAKTTEEWMTKNNDEHLVEQTVRRAMQIGGAMEDSYTTIHTYRESLLRVRNCAA